MVDPLPELRAADFRGGRVLHQIEERNASDAAQPGFQIAQAHGDILPESRFGDVALGHGEQVRGCGMEVLELAVDLVGLGHVFVENFLGDGHKPRMGDPGAVVADGRFAFLVGADLVHGNFIQLHVALVRDVRGHAAHAVHFAVDGRS